jgi:hypothetical protein
MRSKMTFASFDPLFRDTPLECDNCSSPPAFHYELFCEAEEQEPETGFCCMSCAPQLLRKLAGLEYQAWREEEAALKKEGLDASELHDWRVAAFHR